MALARGSEKMLVSDGKLTMSDAEWQEFAAATFAPWRPRTPAEFDAMCALGSARHRVENTDGHGFLHALAAEGMAFGPNQEVNFPISAARRAYLHKHGTWPADEEHRPGPEAGSATPTLTRVK
jgi:hypothetical protein